MGIKKNPDSAHGFNPRWKNIEARIVRTRMTYYIFNIVSNTNWWSRDVKDCEHPMISQAPRLMSGPFCGSARVYQGSVPVDNEGGSAPRAAAQFLFGVVPAATFQVPP
jgi:hypothetical protein